MRRMSPHNRHSIVRSLPYKKPLDFDHMLTFLGRRAVPGVEEVVGGVYRRSLALPRGPAIVELSDGGDHVRCSAFIADARDVSDAEGRCRWIFDVDRDSQRIDDALRRVGLFRAIVARAPGKRVPGAGDGAELAVRAVLGQQVSVGAARTLASRLVATYGTRLDFPRGTVTHLFPTAATLARAGLEGLGAPQARKDAIRTLASAIASGAVELHPGADRADAYRRLLAVPGVGPWTAGYVLMRALRDPDVFLASDLGVRAALRRAGAAHDRDSLKRLAERVGPWGSYATQYLWATLG